MKVSLSFVSVEKDEPDTLHYDVLDNLGKKVGYCKLVFYPDGIYLRYLEILPEYRGKGYAQKFMPVLVEFGRTLGLPEIFLFVDFDNEPAQHIYQKAGFYYPGYMGEFCYLMRYDYIVQNKEEPMR